MDSLDDIFGPPIHIVTRRQLIEDGILIQLSGPGHEGDDWIPAMVAEAGFTVPLAITATAWAEYVWPIEDGARAKWLSERGQDIEGRLWDVLYMLCHAIRRGAGANDDTLTFPLYCVRTSRVPTLGRLKSVCGADDHGSPCITIMLCDEE